MLGWKFMGLALGWASTLFTFPATVTAVAVAHL